MISDGPSVAYLASFVNGNPFKPADLRDEPDGGLPVIRIRQLLDEAADVDYADPPADAVLIGDGDLILAWSATLAARVWRRGPAILNQHLFRVDTAPGVEPRWFGYVLELGVERLKPLMHGSAMTHITADILRLLTVSVPSLAHQRIVADYLDAEISALDNLLAKKMGLVALLQERIDSAIMELVGQSALVEGHRLRALPTRRLLAKLDRPPEPDSQVVTAFRDGQVTARALRRSEGFTESWTDGARVQGVLRSDVVVHGLDGFAGAIGTSESNGVCSPVYHVCSPTDGGDAGFYGRLLRLLATTGYLGNFATSTRERAVDFRNWDLFGRIPIPVVDPAEQRRIGNRIRTLAPVRERVGRSQALINERKHTLITAAITGHIKFPGVAA